MTRLARFALVACATLLATQAHASDPRADAARVLAMFDHEPSVLDVQDAAARYARVHPDAYGAWLDQAAWAYILPDKLEGEVRRTDDDDVDSKSVVGSSLTETKVRDEQLLLQLEVRWDLSKLLFNPDKLKAAKDISKLVERREDVLTTVNKLYFARRDAQVKAVLDPPKNVREMLKSELRISSLTADIDALTGGWFSQQLARAAKSKPAPAPAPAKAARPKPAKAATKAAPVQPAAKPTPAAKPAPGDPDPGE